MWKMLSEKWQVVIYQNFKTQKDICFNFGLKTVDSLLSIYYTYMYSRIKRIAFFSLSAC